jgi:hypothetical protein
MIGKEWKGGGFVVLFVGGNTPPSGQIALQFCPPQNFT